MINVTTTYFENISICTLNRTILLTFIIKLICNKSIDSFNINVINVTFQQLVQ